MPIDYSEYAFCFYWYNPSDSAWAWQCGADNFEKIESLPQKCVCVGVNSTAIISLFERTRQITWLDSLLTQVNKERVNSCAPKHLFMRKFSNNKFNQKPQQYSLGHAFNVKFSKFRGWPRKYMYIYIHTYLCIHIYIYIYQHTYTYRVSHTSIYVRVFIRMYICIHTYTCIYIHT